jgi:hypothetical protein
LQFYPFLPHVFWYSGSGVNIKDCCFF